MDQECGWRRVVAVYSGVHGLSGQESRLLLDAVQGTADKLIASDWGCSRATVSTYWKRIFAKTGMRPQREVLAHLVRFAGTMVPSLEDEGLNVAVRSVGTMTTAWG
jgi:DNA-binding CsgD family transcriptional regulator